MAKRASQQKKIMWIVAAVIILLPIIVLVGVYGDYTGTKVAPGRKFKVLGPNTLTAGQTATITWDASTEGTLQYPYEKIEYCSGSLLKRKCTLLAAAVVNNGKATVRVPASLPVGKGYLQLTARNPQKTLFTSLKSVSGTVTVKPAVVAAVQEDNSDDGDDDDDDDDKRNDDNKATPTVTPTPAPLSALINIPVSSNRLLIPESIPVMLAFTGTPVCAKWELLKEGGETTLLSASDFAFSQVPAGVPLCP